MKKMSSVNCWRTLVASIAIMISMSTSSLYAAVYTNANVAADLTNTTRWVGGVVPTWNVNSPILVWDNTLQNPSACTNATGGGNIQFSGLVIRDPIADVYITNTATYFGFTSRPSLGIDMSSAQKNLAFAGNIYFEFQNSTGTISIATGKTVQFSSIIQRGSTINITNQGMVAYKTWDVGHYNGNGAYLNVMAGTVTNVGSVVMKIGSGGNNYNGVVYQTGGTFHPYSMTVVGQAAISSYTLSGGAVFLRGDLQVCTSVLTGSVNVVGGTLNQSGGAFIVGNGAGIAYYTQSGGSVTIYTNSIASGTGIGMFTISNGTFSATVFGQLASGAGATGTIVLAGGTTTLPAFPTNRGVNASAIVTFDGGTLSPRASTNGYLRGLTAAYVTTNGAVLDTAGYDITISQKLEDFSGHAGRLVKKGAGTLTLSGTN
ncbi:MAG: hypothetical protein WCP12_04665, partial [bacterium]